MSLYLTNTLSGKKELFKPLGDPVKIYICGMTVQGPPHFGHMRAYITSDILIRYLQFSGYKTKVVQNFTDIDDKVIEKAQEQKIDYRVIAQKNIDEYFEVADKMNIKRADIYPKATQHIQEIIELVQKLIDKGFAYESDGDVYFSVNNFKDYGKLSKKKLEDLIAGARVEIREHKKNPADFALWKAAKKDEPYWQSPWSNGRPGWAIECSAMSICHLGETLDFHLGGEDLVFPHHENEIAQSEAATGKEFVRFWIHNAMLNLTGEKMSKSTKHFITAKELLSKYSANVIRLYFLKSHYRSPQEFDFSILDSSKEGWARIEEFLYAVEENHAKANPKSEALNPKLVEAMDDDLNTPKVIALVFDAIKDGFNALQNKNSEEINNKYNEVLFYLSNLGFRTDIKYRTEKRISMSGGTTASSSIEYRDVTKFVNAQELAKTKGHYNIANLIEASINIIDMNMLIPIIRSIARDLAREKKEFEISDLLRKGLEEMGFTLEDTDKGTRIKRKK